MLPSHFKLYHKPTQKSKTTRPPVVVICEYDTLLVIRVLSQASHASYLSVFIIVYLSLAFVTICCHNVVK